MSAAPLEYHGLTVRDAVLYIAAQSEGTFVPSQAAIRQWVNRGNVRRTKDGHIDVVTLEEWWRYQRDHARGARKDAA